MVDIKLKKQGVYLGRAGETGRKRVWVDITAWEDEYGPGEGLMLYRNPEGKVIPMETVREEGTDTEGQTWVRLYGTVGETETAVAGVGNIEARLLCAGVVAKSDSFGTVVVSSMNTGKNEDEKTPKWVRQLMTDLKAARIYVDTVKEIEDVIDGYRDAAEEEMLASEAWAKGTRNGEPVGETDPAYGNNSKKYATDSEAWAVGKRGGVDVDSEDEAYENNAKKYMMDAGGSATAALSLARDSEAWANGTQAGQAIPNTHPAYEKNAKYWSEHAFSATPEGYEDLVDGVDDLKSAITKDKPIAAEVTIINGEYVDGNGAFKPYSSWSRTDYIPVNPGSTITIVSTARSEYNFSYNASKEPIGSKWTVAAGTTTKTVDSSTHYIVLSGTTAMMTSIVVYAGDKLIVLADDLPLTTEMDEQIDGKIDYRTQADQVVNPTAYLMRLQIPNYYFSRSETALTKEDIGYLDNKINTIPDGYHFMFVTDTHWNDNAQQSTKLISYVRDRIGAKIVLFGGDILTAHASSAIAYRWLCDFTFDFKNAFGSNFLPVVGNHDLNSMGEAGTGLAYSDLVPVYTQGCDNRYHYCDYYDSKIDAMQTAKGMTDAETAAMKQYFRTCYYVDDLQGKTRYIIYNTGAGNGGSGITQYISSYITGSYEEMLIMDWIYDTVMHTPSGYNIIFCTHIPGDFSWSAGNSNFLSSTRSRFAALVAGIKAKKSIAIYLPNDISDYSWWGGQNLTYNYTDAPDFGVVAVMGGHTHVDTFGRYGFTSGGYDSSHIGSIQMDVNGLTATCYQSSTTYESGVHYIAEIPVILTQHDAYINNSGPNSHTMTLGTVTEQVIDVVTITPAGNIALTRIGAGYDRLLTIE